MANAGRAGAVDAQLGPAGRRLRAELGSTLLAAARAAGVPLAPM